MNLSKKLGIAVLFAGLISSIVSAETVDITRYKDMPDVTKTASVIVENFDGPLDGWKLSPHFRQDMHAGVTGSGALIAERKIADEAPMAEKEIELRHGVVYRISLTYRSKMKFDPKLPMQQLFCVRFYKDGKYDSGAFHAIRESGSAEEWKTMSKTFQVPDDCSSAVCVQLFIRAARIGTVWYDNLTIEPVSARSCYVYLLSPAAYQLDETGKILFHVLKPAKTELEDLRLLLKINGQDHVLPVRGTVAAAELGNLPEGEYPAEFILLNVKKEEIIARDTATFYRRKSENPNGVTVDDGGFLRRHGKRYLPIGIFLGSLDPQDRDIYKRVRAGGFNSVEALGREQLYHGRKKTLLESIRLGMREMAKNDPTFMYAIKYQIPCKRPCIKKMDGIEGLEKVNEYLINGLKNEPNLLGWYVSDENPLSEIPEILHLRKTLAKYDPEHPTFTLTNIEDNFYDFARTGDFLMPDVYPIGENINRIGIEEQTMSLCRNHLEKSMRTGLPIIWVPQIFAWKSFRKDDPVFRYPTEQEIRSMVLLGTVVGVKGYYFYAYHPVFYYSEKLDPGKSAEQWARITPSAKLLQELTPYIVSEDKAPELTVTQISGKKISGRALRDGENVAVVLTADGPGNASAEIRTVPGLVSRYGKTRETAPGVYVFNAENVDSDVLFSKPDGNGAPPSSGAIPAGDMLEEVKDGVFAAFSGEYEISSDQPVEGKYCMVQGNDSEQASIALTERVIPVKPNTTYQLQVYARNNIPSGSIIFGFGQSRSAEEFKITCDVEWGRTQLPCNIPEWKPCVVRFTTFPETRGLRIFFKVENSGIGKAWWDKLTITEVDEKTPAVTFQPFPLWASWTDLPTMTGRRNTKNLDMEWVEQKADQTPLQLTCNAFVPADAEITLSVSRAGKTVFEQRRKASEKLEFILPLESWPAGKYLVRASAVSDGKELCFQEKVLWRQISVQEEKLAPIGQVSTLPDRLNAVNGKPFYPIFYSHFPARVCRPDFTEYPNMATILPTSKQQLGVNVLSVIAEGTGPSLKLPREEYLPKAIEFYSTQYRKQLDFCKEHNMYGDASLHMGSYSPQSGFRKCCLTLLKKKTGRFEAVIQICHCGIVQNLFVRKKSCLN